MMKPKNIYKLGMVFSIFIAFFPLLFYISANIVSLFIDCGVVKDLSQEVLCPGGEIVATLYVWSWFIIITFPIGFFIWLIFFLLYLSVRRR